MKLTITNQQSKPRCIGVVKLSHHLKGQHAATFCAFNLNKTEPLGKDFHDTFRYHDFFTIASDFSNNYKLSEEIKCRFFKK